MIQNPWYIVTIVALTTGNRPEAIPPVFKYVLNDLERAQNEFKVPKDEAQKERLRLARRFRDAIFKCGILAGYSKACCTLIPGDRCIDKLPPGDKFLNQSSRGHTQRTAGYNATEVSAITKRSRRESLVTEEIPHHRCPSLKSVAKNSSEISMVRRPTTYRVSWITYIPTWVRASYCPSPHDWLNNGHVGWFSNTIAYGSVYGHLDILNQLETSYVLVGALIAADTPRQIVWHLDNARRGGASLEQTRAVRQIAIEVSQSVGVKWRESVPEVKE